MWFTDWGITGIVIANVTITVINFVVITIIITIIISYIIILVIIINVIIIVIIINIIIIVIIINKIIWINIYLWSAVWSLLVWWLIVETLIQSNNNDDGVKDNHEIAINQNYLEQSHIPPRYTHFPLKSHASCLVSARRRSGARSWRRYTYPRHWEDSQTCPGSSSDGFT